MTQEIPITDKNDYGFPDGYDGEVSTDGGVDEIVPQGEMYEFPDAYLVRIEEYGVNSPEASIVQGALYDWMREDVRPSNQEAVDVGRALNNGNVEEAWDLVDEALER